MKMISLLGEEVQIYPGDTHKKYGIILDITDGGVLFEIIRADICSGYTQGDIVFISYSANLSFRKVNN